MNYRGVWFDPKRRKYRAACEHQGRSILIGRYDTAEQAAHAYDLKATELWGNQAVLNFREYSRSTAFQLKCYRLCSPDFAGLTQRQAAVILGTKNSAVCVALRRLRVKCRKLFPIYRVHGKVLRYSEWMDFNVVKEF